MAATKKKAKESSIADFEELFGDLEKIIQGLESGKFPLGESLEKFEEGLKLYKNCQGLLVQAEERIKVLTDELKEEDY